ncbi:MAG: hypothetical protein A2X18_05980 [Bacteroidetes bacterium GWF2_40_14]|nr:MAG: hypothetical protein A2X18_05980 [Bacteroidetes bacterium GWF2_40_14]
MKQLLFILTFSLLFVTGFAQNKNIFIFHYVFQNFKPGVVYMKSGIIDKYMLNYNSITEEMLFDEKNQILAIGKTEIGLIDSVVIEGRKFVVLNDKFVELLYHANNCELFASYTCSVIPPGKPSAYGGVSHTSASISLSAMNFGGLLYNLELPDGYTTKPRTHYLIKKNGELHKFLSMQQIKNFYNKRKSLFNEFVRENKLKYEDRNDIAKLIEFMDTAN